MKKNLLLATLIFAGASTFAQVTRLSLFEEFTGETCNPCAATNPGLNTTLLSATNAGKVIAIKWQVPIPTAPTNTWSLYQTNPAEANARLGYYSVNSAPQGRMDGQSLTVFGASSDHAANVNNTLISNAQSIMSPFSITMNRAWDATCSSVNLTITVQAAANFTTASALNFRTVMVERLIQFSVQPGTNGETTFYDAAIKSFPTIQNGYGLNTAWVTGQTQTFTLNCPIPSYTRNKSEIAFVGFIQNEANKQVLQAVRADKVNIPTDALTSLDTKVNVTCSSTIAPQITIKNSGSNPITSFTVTPYTDGIAATPLTTWSGNLAVGATTTMILNTTSTPTTLGAHTFSYVLTMNNPYNYFNVSNKAKYLVATSSQINPVMEDFALATFPPANWVPTNSNNGPSWSRVVYTGSYANSSDFGCAKFDCFNNTVSGDVDELYLPPVDLSGSGAPSLSFDVAKAVKNNENDQLDVLISSDCGATWTNVYSKAGQILATTGVVASSFSATTAQDWITETVIFPTAFAVPNVLVKFKVTNDNGNNLYLDNINLLQPSTVGVAKNSKNNSGVSIFPNPANNETTLTVNSDNTSASTLKVVNSIGQTVYAKQITVNAGANNFKIDTKEFAAGIYFVIVDSEKNQTTKKLIITK